VSAWLVVMGRHDDISASRRSNIVLGKFAKYLRDNPGHNPEMPLIDAGRFIRDVDRGLYLRSGIPENYGIGSSGAVCAAIYDEYGRGPESGIGLTDQPGIQMTRAHLAAMESYFHGQSSGVDPSCIYFNKPLIVEGRNSLTVCHPEQLKKQEIRSFLLDTGISGNTGEQVRSFRKSLTGHGLDKNFTEQYIPLVNQIVDQLTGGIPAYDSLLKLSGFQQELFRDMIPEAFHSVWQFGLDTGSYACKLCGSGGGGYILGFTADFERAGRILAERYSLSPIRIDVF